MKFPEKNRENSFNLTSKEVINRNPRVFMQVASISLLVLSLLGCTAGPKKTQSKETPRPVQKKKKVSALSQEKTIETVPGPLSTMDQLAEKECFLKLKNYSQKITTLRDKYEILEMEKGLDGANIEGLGEDQDECKKNLEIAAFKAFEAVLLTNPRCWPRLLSALASMTKKDPQTADLESFGEIEENTSSPKVIALQEVMYKEVMELAAIFVARSDQNLEEIRKLDSPYLNQESREKLDTAIDNLEKLRMFFIKKIEDGSLFPEKPSLKEEDAKKLLQLFNKKRSESGGLPVGNSIAPKHLKCGKSTEKTGDNRSEKKPISSEKNQIPKNKEKIRRSSSIKAS